MVNFSEKDMDQDEHVTLGRIDERVRSLHASINRIEVALERYVLLVRYITVERLVFGLAGVILLSVVVGMIALVVRK